MQHKYSLKRTGLMVALSTATHNISEGITVSVPIYYATENRKKAFWYSFASGLAEPFGALIAYIFLIEYWTPTLNGIVLSIVSGIMVSICLKQLLSSAEKYVEHQISIIRLMLGMAGMAFSRHLFL